MPAFAPTAVAARDAPMNMKPACLGAVSSLHSRIDAWCQNTADMQVDELKAQNRTLLERVIRACPTPSGRGQAGPQQMRRTRSGNL